jgi:hypothetical protein
MKRLHLLLGLVVIAAVLLLPSAPAGLGAGVPPISLASIPDQTLDIYPGLLPTTPTTVPLTVDPADAAIAIRTSSTDKASVVINSDSLVITPTHAGTEYVQVTAAEAGYASSSQTFAVHVVAKTENGYNWSSAKIGGSGYVTGEVFSKIEPNVLYAMTDMGGAYRYDFSRDYWVALTDEATSTSSAYSATSPNGPGSGETFVTGIMPDPVQKGRVYMAAGSSATNAAVYRSEDYGANWQRFPTPITMNGNDGSNRSTGPRLAIDPKNNNIVYYASQSQGLWKSSDAGQTFARVTGATGTPVYYNTTFVTFDPNSPVDASGNSTRIIVGTIGATSTTPPTVAVDPLQQRPYKSLYITNDGGSTFTQLPGQPAANPTRQYGGFVAEHPAWDWNGKLVVAYAEFNLNNFGSVGSNSNFAQDGRVYRFDVAAGTSENVTPQNVYTKQYPDLTPAQIASGQVMQRGGIGGISVDPERPGVMVASSFHRHQDFSEEVVWYTNDYGASWKVIHSEVVGKMDYRGVGYVDKNNGWGSAVHWAFDIQINPYDSNMALFNTGNGVWMTKNLEVADQPITKDNQVVWGFWDDGIEQTADLSLMSPTHTDDYLISTLGDWGVMSWGKDYTVSPKNTQVNAESPVQQVKYLDPAFDAAGNPRYDLDANGNIQKQVEPGHFERWINGSNMDYAGLKQNVMVSTPSGNYQNTNMSAGVISFDEGKTATPLAAPLGATEPTAQTSSGWISISADANTVVWSVSNTNITSTYYADVSQGANSAVVGSDSTRPVAVSEIRQVVKNGDRTAWAPSVFYATTGALVASGSVNIYSDKFNPNVFYAFTGTTMYVSEDSGRTFRAKTVGGVGIPSGAKVQIDVYNTRSIWLAPNTTAGGLVHVTYNTSTGTWTSAKVSPGTTSTFQWVGEGLGVGDNSVPALYATGVISDNSVSPAAAAYYGQYRSLDGGATWKRINDNKHQFGLLSALSGDSRVFGRVYIGSNGLGIRVGEVNWNTDTGSTDSSVIPATITADSSASSVDIQYSDGVPSSTLTVTGTVEDEVGSNLTADAVGLPAGLSLTTASTSDERTFPGTQTWKVSGTTTVASGSFPVTVTISDPDGWNRETSFTINVAPEDARTTFTGPTLVSTVSLHSSLAAISLSTTVQDISVTPDAAGDTTSGDIRNATVKFVNRDTGDTLCEVPFHVMSGSSTSTGTAVCSIGVDIGAADELSFTVGTVVGGYYTRDNSSEDAVVRVVRATVPIHNLGVSTQGTGSGSVTSSPAGIDCGADCSGEFEQGTVVTLTATPAPDSVFSGWSGGGCSGTGDCTVTLSGDREVTATFTKKTHTLSIHRQGTGSGTVTSSPAGISCGGDGNCSHDFDQGTVVTLTVTPAAHSTFTGWSGAGCSGTGSCTVTVSDAESVTATFTKKIHDLSVSTDGTGSGTVTSSPAGIDCGSNCKGSFDEGTVVTLTANAASDSTFTGWSGAGCSGTGSCTVTVSDAESVTATFEKQASPAVSTGAPNTRIVKASINRGQKRASFRFTGSGKGKLRFQCSLDGKRFASCHSGVVYKHLKKGAHNFRVRAKAGAKVDPTPAKKRFRI